MVDAPGELGSSSKPLTGGFDDGIDCLKLVNSSAPLKIIRSHLFVQDPLVVLPIYGK